MISRLKTYCFRQVMHPGLFGLMVDPFYFALRGLPDLDDVVLARKVAEK